MYANAELTAIWRVLVPLPAPGSLAENSGPSPGGWSLPRGSYFDYSNGDGLPVEGKVHPRMYEIWEFFFLR